MGKETLPTDFETSKHKKGRVVQETRPFFTSLLGHGMSIYEELRGTIYGKEMAVRVAVLYFDPFQCMKTAKLILQGDEICKSTISLGN